MMRGGKEDKFSLMLERSALVCVEVANVPSSIRTIGRGSVNSTGISSNNLEVLPLTTSIEAYPGYIDYWYT